MQVVRVIGNILWFLLAGFWLALGYAVAGIAMFILIITIPFGVQAFKMAGYVIWPFGRVVVDDPEVSEGWSTFGNILWLLIAGWWLALVHVVAGVLLFVTIIGIPFGVAAFKLAYLAVWPFGRRVVTEAEAMAMVEAPRVQVKQLGASQPATPPASTTAQPEA